MTILGKISVKKKLALLYALKYGAEKAAVKYLVPYNELKQLLSNPEVINLLNNSEFKFKILEEAFLSGYDFTEISESISWKDFEELVSKILLSHGYEVHKNFRIKKPMREIDVLARKGNIRIAVDCKNWIVKLYNSKMKDIISRHSERANLLKRMFKQDKIIPVIVTIYPYKTTKVNDIFIVSINDLKDFIRQIPYI